LGLAAPQTNPRKQIHRPASFAIVHDGKLALVSEFASDREVKPIGVSSGIDVIVQKEAVQVSDLRDEC